MSFDGAQPVQRGRYWIYTIWLHKLEDGPEWLGLSDNDLVARGEHFFDVEGFTRDVCYARWQFERCPNTARPHVQAFIVFRSIVGHRGITKALPGLKFGMYNGTYISNNHNQSRLYASKLYTSIGGQSWEYGAYVEPGGPNIGRDPNGEKQSKQGSRGDLIWLGELLKSGTTPSEIAMVRPDLAIKFGKHIEHVYQVLNTPEWKRSKPRDCYVLVGPPGTGKTRCVGDSFDSKEIFTLAISQSKAVWYDGYIKQRVCLFDEFDGTIDYHALKRILDPWYNARAPVKGTHCVIASDIIFLVSNISPKNWYPNVSQDQFGELARRVKKWIWFGKIEDIPDYGKYWYNIPWVHKDQCVVENKLIV